MSKKDETVKNDNTGKRGLYATFDESRFLRLDLAAQIWIEEHAVPGRAVPINVVIGGMNRTGFLSIVLRAALGMVHNEPRLKEEDVSDIYEAYIEKTGDRSDLEALLREVYELASRNPIKLAREKEEKKTKEPSGSVSPT